MIKVSHEMPLCLLKNGTEKKVNAYFYALVHLFEDHQDYYQYTVDQIKEGREVILDNSAYELHGKPFDTEGFVKWIRKIGEDTNQASERRLVFVIPDEFDEMEATYQRAESFLEDYPDLPGKAMVVCQGKTIYELMLIFKKYSHLQGVRKIGINFMSLAYTDFVEKSRGPDIEQWLARSMGRKFFIEFLYHSGLLHGRVIHLLGSSLPDEFRYYTIEHPKLGDFIDSLDTSAPIIHGMFSNSLYDSESKLFQKKSSEKLAEHLLDPVSVDQLVRILHNTEVFRIHNGL